MGDPALVPCMLLALQKLLHALLPPTEGWGNPNPNSRHISNLAFKAETSICKIRKSVLFGGRICILFLHLNAVIDE